jgi:hypothetical protein
MPPEESPEEKFDRLKKRLQESILRDFPNPERKGCPGGAVLQELAERSLSEAVESDRHWHHLTHCSECYREFLAFNDAFRHSRKVNRTRVIWGSAVAAAVIVVALVVSLWSGSIRKRPQNAELAYAKRTVVISSIVRSPGADEPKPIVLERLPLDLTVELPVGSRAGFYELKLNRDGQPVLSSGGNAEIHDGTTAFTVRVNLSGVTPGSYSMEVRQVPLDWNLYPVVVR